MNVEWKSHHLPLVRIPNTDWSSLSVVPFQTYREAFSSLFTKVCRCDNHFFSHSSRISSLVWHMHLYAWSRKINLERRKYSPPLPPMEPVYMVTELDWKFDEQLISRLRSKKRNRVSSSKIAPNLGYCFCVKSFSWVMDSCNLDCAVSRSCPSINVSGCKAVNNSECKILVCC